MCSNLSTRARRTQRLLPCIAALAVAACAADLPQAPPPADAVPSPGLYTLSPGTPADGTIRITLTRGGTAARGVLDTNAQRFRITVTGLGVQDGTGARTEVVGQVFGLQRSSDVAGTYRVVGDASAAAADFAGGLRLGNDNLVLLRLRPQVEGTALTVAPGGMTVSLGP